MSLTELNLKSLTNFNPVETYCKSMKKSIRFSRVFCKILHNFIIINFCVHKVDKVIILICSEMYEFLKEFTTSVSPELLQSRANICWQKSPFACEVLFREPCCNPSKKLDLRQIHLVHLPKLGPNSKAESNYKIVCVQYNANAVHNHGKTEANL